MKKSKKKAFTLTELLIVVIVIGVLSAAVLPKFNKVIETRKTTEAEDLMASVRTEQEKRCALDKRYLTQMSELKDIVKNNETKNFTITLASKGIDAASKGKYSYTLKMLSYADGRICCDGTECSKLNKNYPTCDELRGKPDYQESPENCAGPSAVRGCAGDAKEPCGCKDGGIRTRTCDTATGTWSNWSECSISDVCSCEGEANQSCGCAGKGTQTRTCDTATGTWSEWGECSIADTCACPESTKPKTSQTCNSCGTQTRKVDCNTETGEWTTGSWSTCSKTTAQCNPTPPSPSDPCAECTSCLTKCNRRYDATFCESYCAYSCSGCIDIDCGTSCGTDCGTDCGTSCGTSCGTDCGSSGLGSGEMNCVLCTDIHMGSVVCPNDMYMKHVDGSCQEMYKNGYHCTTQHAC